MRELVEEMKKKSLGVSELLGIQYLVKKRAEKKCIQEKENLKYLMGVCLKNYQKTEQLFWRESYEFYAEQLQNQSCKEYRYQSAMELAGEYETNNPYIFHEILALGVIHK